MKNLIKFIDFGLWFERGLTSDECDHDVQDTDGANPHHIYSESNITRLFGQDKSKQEDKLLSKFISNRSESLPDTSRSLKSLKAELLFIAFLVNLCTTTKYRAYNISEENAR